MITVRITGGLGNQIFQWALGRALEHLGREVVYDRSKIAVNNGGHAFYGLDGYGIKPRFGTTNGPIIRDGDMAYNSDVFNRDGVVLDGCWQSEKYFQSVQSDIRKQLVPVELPPQHLVDKCQGNTVAMQVRRGDYVRLQNWHGLMPLSYYEAGYQAVHAADPNPKVLIFSDDPEWCRQNMPGEVLATGNRFWDIYLISQCRHAVIANSSFGWWGAWLGEKPNGVIVAPKKWFATPTLDSSSIVPERWTKV